MSDADVSDEQLFGESVDEEDGAANIENALNADEEYIQKKQTQWKRVLAYMVPVGGEMPPLPDIPAIIGNVFSNYYADYPNARQKFTVEWAKAINPSDWSFNTYAPFIKRVFYGFLAYGIRYMLDIYSSSVDAMGLLEWKYYQTVFTEMFGEKIQLLHRYDEDFIKFSETNNFRIQEVDPSVSNIPLKTWVNNLIMLKTTVGENIQSVTTSLATFNGSRTGTPLTASSHVSRTKQRHFTQKRWVTMLGNPKTVWKSDETFDKQLGFQKLISIEKLFVQVYREMETLKTNFSLLNNLLEDGQIPNMYEILNASESVRKLFECNINLFITEMDAIGDLGRHVDKKSLTKDDMQRLITEDKLPIDISTSSARCSAIIKEWTVIEIDNNPSTIGVLLVADVGGVFAHPRLRERNFLDKSDFLIYDGKKSFDFYTSRPCYICKIKDYKWDKESPYMSSRNTLKAIYFANEINRIAQIMDASTDVLYHYYNMFFDEPSTSGTTQLTCGVGNQTFNPWEPKENARFITFGVDDDVSYPKITPMEYLYTGQSDSVYLTLFKKIAHPDYSFLSIMTNEHPYMVDSTTTSHPRPPPKINIIWTPDLKASKSARTAGAGGAGAGGAGADGAADGGAAGSGAAGSGAAGSGTAGAGAAGAGGAGAGGAGAGGAGAGGTGADGAADGGAAGSGAAGSGTAGAGGAGAGGTGADGAADGGAAGSGTAGSGTAGAGAAGAGGAASGGAASGGAAGGGAAGGGAADGGAADESEDESEGSWPLEQNMGLAKLTLDTKRALYDGKENEEVHSTATMFTKLSLGGKHGRESGDVPDDLPYSQSLWFTEAYEPNWKDIAEYKRLQKISTAVTPDTHSKDQDMGIKQLDQFHCEAFALTPPRIFDGYTRQFLSKLDMAHAYEEMIVVPLLPKMSDLQQLCTYKKSTLQNMQVRARTYLESGMGDVEPCQNVFQIEDSARLIEFIGTHDLSDPNFTSGQVSLSTMIDVIKTTKLKETLKAWSYADPTMTMGVIQLKNHNMKHNQMIHRLNCTNFIRERYTNTKIRSLEINGIHKKYYALLRIDDEILIMIKSFNGAELPAAKRPASTKTQRLGMVITIIHPSRDDFVDYLEKDGSYLMGSIRELKNTIVGIVDAGIANDDGKTYKLIEPFVRVANTVNLHPDSQKRTYESQLNIACVRLAQLQTAHRSEEDGTTVWDTAEKVLTNQIIPSKGYDSVMKVHLNRIACGRRVLPPSLPFDIAMHVEDEVDQWKLAMYSPIDLDHLPRCGFLKAVFDMLNIVVSSKQVDDRIIGKMSKEYMSSPAL